MEGKIQLKKENVFLKKNSLIKKIWKSKFLFFLGLPGILCFIIFKYVPMYGLIIAFKEYSPFVGVFDSEWVGFAHFERLFSDPDFFRIFRNTITISILGLVVFPAPIFLALLLNEVRSNSYKRTIQTIIYLPHFISWVILISLTYLFFSSEQGMINKLIVLLGGDKFAFLFDPNYFYPLIIGQGLWKNIGWNSIIYLAAIAGVDQNLYEAAIIDGAGRFKQIVHITIASIMPTIVVLFVINLGNILDSNFEQLWLMQNPMVNKLAEVFETYVYKTGVRGGQYSYTTAVGMFKSIIGFIMVILANRYANKKGYEGIW